MKIKSFLLVLIFALAPAMWAQDKPLFPVPAVETKCGPSIAKK